MTENSTENATRVAVPCGVCGEDLMMLRTPVYRHEFVHGTCVGRPDLILMERLIQPR